MFIRETQRSWRSVIGNCCLSLLLLPFVGQAQNRVTLLTGTVAGQAVSVADPQIEVQPGAAIQGSFTVRVHNEMPGSAIAPLAATPTWGTPSTSYWTVNSWVGTGDTTQTVPVNLTAPQFPGVYYVAVAMAGTYNAAQIMSGTHPAWSADWVNGTKVAWLPPVNLDEGINTGLTPFKWYSPNGAIPGTLALTAIRIVVGAPPSCQALYSQDFTADPGWSTSNPGAYHWNADGTYTLTMADSSGSYATTPVQLVPGESFKFEFDVNISRLDYAGDITFGLYGAGRYAYPEAGVHPFLKINFGKGDLGSGILLQGYDSTGALKQFNQYPSSFGLNTNYHVVVAYDKNTHQVSGLVMRKSDNLTLFSERISNVGGFSDLVYLGASKVGDNYSSGSTGIAKIDNVTLCQPGLASADLVLSKATAQDVVLAGKPIQFSLSVTNLGPNTANNVVVRAPLPLNAEFVSCSPGGELVNGAVVFSVGTLLSGASASMEVTLRGMASGFLTNAAVCEATGSDPNLQNNQAQAVTLVVGNPCELVEKLITKVNMMDLDVHNRRPLIATLQAAYAAFDRTNWTAAVNQLQAFQNKVKAQVADPSQAEELVQNAQEIIDLVAGADLRLELLPAGQGARIHFKGWPGKAYRVEASADLQTWTDIGEAVLNGEGRFEKKDSGLSGLGRFYRLK